MKNKKVMSIILILLGVVVITTSSLSKTYDVETSDVNLPVQEDVSTPSDSLNKPDSKEVQPDGTAEGQHETLSSLDLSGYEVIVNCSLTMITDSPSLVKISYPPVDNNTATEIGKTAFGLSEVVVVKRIPWDGILLRQQNKEIEFFGINRIYYNEEYTNPVIEEWNEKDVLDVAEKFLSELNYYWEYESQVTAELSSIKPACITIEIDPETNEETEIIRAIGVNYQLNVDGIDLMGPGADFSIWVANNRVISAEIHKPAITKTEATVKVKSPEEALDDFLTGKGKPANLGFESLYPPIAKEGTCTIYSVKLGYYVDFSREYPESAPLLYKIAGSLSYKDDEGEDISLDFVEYQLAVN